MAGPNTAAQVDNVTPAETIKAGWDKYNAHWHPLNVSAKTGAYTLLTADVNKLIDATANTWTLTLPAAATAGDGFWFAVRNSGTGVITIDGDSSEQIDGATTVALNPGESALVICNGTAWKTVGRVSAAAGAVTRTAGDVTTTSASLVDLTGASVTLTTGPRRVLLTFTCTTSNSSAGADHTFNFLIDAALAFGSGGVIHETSETGGSEDNAFSMTFLTDVLSAGSHTFKVQWKVDVGTGTVRANSANAYHFSAVELPAAA